MIRAAGGMPYKNSAILDAPRLSGGITPEAWNVKYEAWYRSNVADPAVLAGAPAIGQCRGHSRRIGSRSGDALRQRILASEPEGHVSTIAVRIRHGGRVAQQSIAGWFVHEARRS
jgi:hypothetical protein